MPDAALAESTATLLSLVRHAGEAAPLFAECAAGGVGVLGSDNPITRECRELALAYKQP